MPVPSAGTPADPAGRVAIPCPTARALVAALALLPALLAASCQAFRTADRETLEALYMDERSETASVAGMDVHLRDEGAGPPLLLLHGATASLHTWEAWARELVDEYRVLRIDLPPSGLTGPHPEGRYDPEAYLELVDGILEHTGARQPVLVGNSLGGYVAARYAARWPERVRGLILLNPAGYPQSLPWTLRLPAMRGIGRLFQWVTPRWVVARGVASAYGDPDRVEENVVDRYWHLLRAPGNRAGVRELARTMDRLRQEEPEWVADIDVPTLVIWGDEDEFTPVEFAERWEQDLPRGTAVILDGVGHVPMEEVPARSLEVVRPHLREWTAERAEGACGR